MSAVQCIPLSSQRHLRSRARKLLHVPRHRISTYGRQVLSVLVHPPGTVPRTYVHNSNAIEAAFRRLLYKGVCSHYSASRALWREGVAPAMRYTNLHTDLTKWFFLFKFAVNRHIPSLTSSTFAPVAASLYRGAGSTLTLSFKILFCSLTRLTSSAPRNQNVDELYLKPARVITVYFMYH